MLTCSGLRQVVRQATVMGLVGLLAGASALLSGCMNVPAKLQEAAAAASAGNWQSAQELAEKCLHKEKTNVTALVLNGIALHELGNSEAAAVQLEQAALLGPNDYAAQYFCGWVLSENGRHGEALIPLRRANELRKNNQDLLVLLSRCCMAQNLPEGAKYLQQLRRFPAMDGRPELYNDLGVLWMNQGLYDLAVKNLLTAWQKDPKSVVIPQNLAVLYDQYMHNPVAALPYYRFCYNKSLEMGDTLRAAQVNERIVLLAAELPKAPVAVPAPSAATGSVKTGPAVKPTTGKTPLKPVGKSATGSKSGASTSKTSSTSKSTKSTTKPAATH